MKYLEISVSSSHAVAEFVGSVLTDFGSEGVATYDPQDLQEILTLGKTWDYIDENLIPNADAEVVVKGYFYTEPDMEGLRATIRALRDYNQDCGTLSIVSQWQDDEIYKDEWKKYFKTAVFGCVAIVPSWCETVEGKINVLLDPGAAFGTGAHETTSMCLSAMQTLSLNNSTVIDLGCGSAILGLAALKLGASRVTFIDVDEMALGVAKSNIELNNCQDKSSVFCGDLRQIDIKADVVLANITADVLMMFCNDLARHVNHGGKLILSGIIDREFERVKDGYINSGFAMLAHEKVGDWHCMTMGYGNHE